MFSRIIVRDEASSVGHPGTASTPALPNRSSEYALLQALRHALRQALIPTEAETAFVAGERERRGEGEDGVMANGMADWTQHQYHQRRRRVEENHKHRDDFLRGSHATSPLVLDAGAVMSVPMSSGEVTGRGGSQYSSSNITDSSGETVAVWNYVVSFPTIGTITGFPSERKEASSVEQGSRDRDGNIGVVGNDAGSGPDGRFIPYAMVTCEEDLKTLMDKAAIGADVLAKPRGELEERNSGEASRAVGCGDGYGLGGVDKQVCR